MTSNSSKMPSEDIELIRQHGVPLDLKPEFVSVGRDGSVKFTPRGRRVYRFACLMCALSPEEVERVHDLGALRNLSLKVKRVRVLLAADALERARQGGRIPVKARAVVEAALHGTVEDLREAVANRLAAEAAGSNVIPVSFKRLRH